ncbi:MAG: RDD family protein [Candidatus Woesearchaeota archaeon]|nr:RDD family protein [Candidatus Woesearchaeota archaeon]
MKLNLPKERIIITDASWWKRAFSFFIDFSIIQLIIFSPFSSVIESKLPLSSDFMENYRYFESNPDLITNLMAVIGIVFFLILLYFVMFEYKMGQTPGKMLFKLKVLPLDKEEINLWKILARNIAVLPVFPFSLLWIVDPLYLIFTGKRLSDMFSKTRVVEEVRVI